MVPQGTLCSKTHEWVRLDSSNGVASVGITDFAVEQLGDIVFLELPSVGKDVKKGQQFGVIESVKAAVELYSPIDGTVVQANALAAEALDTVSTDPFGAGWMIQVKPADPSQLSSLMSAEAYQKYLDSDEVKKE
jgi:glycine cleavage system H protein